MNIEKPLILLPDIHGTMDTKLISDLQESMMLSQQSSKTTTKTSGSRQRVNQSITSASSSMASQTTSQSQTPKKAYVPLLSRPERLFAQLQAGRQRREQRSNQPDDTRRINIITQARPERQRSHSDQPRPTDFGALKTSKPRLNSFGPLSRLNGMRDLIWSYRTDAEADGLMRKAGVWPWSPPSTYYQPLNQLAIEEGDQFERAPLIIMPGSSGKTEPNMMFTGTHVLIQPHSPHWPDARAHTTHPDFIPPLRLAEHQACEVAGYCVWRHDRNTFICSFESCHTAVSDFNPRTRVCVGCGPRSCTRYCCQEHEVKDFKNHWKICGSPSLIAPCVMDKNTMPTYFDNLCPAVISIGHHRSFEFHRQRYFACHSRGHYTLFDKDGEKNRILTWPKKDPGWQEMNSRIERLLNIGFLDNSRHNILRYLYGILRHLLSISPFFDKPRLEDLKIQFISEFGHGIFEGERMVPIFPCECIWVGRRLPPQRHLRNCEFRGKRQEQRGNGFLDITSQLEAEYWILRAWRQQHATVSDWRKRAKGNGFQMGSKSVDIKLGPGFTGWGAEPCNSCG